VSVVASTAARNWQRRAAELCREILPGPPVYILTDRQVPSHFRTRECCGYTGRWLDLQLESVIRERGKWQGRGFTAITTTAWRRTLSPNELTSIVLHELSHFAVSLAADRDLLAEKGRDQLRQMNELTEKAATARDLSNSLPRTFEEWLATLAPEVAAHIRSWPQGKLDALAAEMFPAPKPIAAWGGHELPFIRAALHVQHRAERLGFTTTADAIGLAGHRYGLSKARVYLDALCDEPRQREAEGLLDVLRSPAPRSAQVLFERDTAAHAA